MLVPLIALSVAAGTGDTALVRPRPDFDMSAISASDARLSVVQRGRSHALRVATGHAQPWPGITIRAAGGRWDLTRHTHVSVQLHNPGPNPVQVFGLDPASGCP